MLLDRSKMGRWRPNYTYVPTSNCDPCTCPLRREDVGDEQALRIVEDTLFMQRNASATESSYIRGFW